MKHDYSNPAPNEPNTQIQGLGFGAWSMRDFSFRSGLFSWRAEMTPPYCRCSSFAGRMMFRAASAIRT
jgi:hypothetical protein